jgi:hypothetical protein
MNIIRTGLVAMILVTMVACATMTPKQLARNATVATLTLAGADKETAEDVLEIAVDVRDAVKKDGTLDRAALLKQIDEQIAKLDQKPRAILMALRTQIVDIVAQAAADNQDVTEILVIIRDVAEGTAEGAELYLQSFEVPEVIEIE